MNKINDEIKLTLDLMQPDLYEGSLNELQYHLLCLLEMKRERLGGDHTEEVDYKDKPLTTEELLAGGWWCKDTSEACRLAFIANGVSTEVDRWEENPIIQCAYKKLPYVPVLRAHGPITLSGIKQIYRIGNNFYWSEK